MVAKNESAEIKVPQLSEDTIFDLEKYILLLPFDEFILVVLHPVFDQNETILFPVIFNAIFGKICSFGHKLYARR